MNEDFETQTDDLDVDLDDSTELDDSESEGIGDDSTTEQTTFEIDGQEYTLDEIANLVKGNQTTQQDTEQDDDLDLDALAERYTPDVGDYATESEEALARQTGAHLANLHQAVAELLKYVRPIVEERQEDSRATQKASEFSQLLGRPVTAQEVKAALKAAGGSDVKAFASLQGSSKPMVTVRRPGAVPGNSKARTDKPLSLDEKILAALEG
jgi:hypothetical protein